VDNFLEKLFTLWQRYNKKSKGLFFMKHPVYAMLNGDKQAEAATINHITVNF